MFLRPLLRVVKNHPLFWSPLKRLEFLVRICIMLYSKYYIIDEDDRESLSETLKKKTPAIIDPKRGVKAQCIEERCNYLVELFYRRCPPSGDENPILHSFPPGLDLQVFFFLLTKVCVILKPVWRRFQRCNFFWETCISLKKSVWSKKIYNLKCVQKKLSITISFRFSSHFMFWDSLTWFCISLWVVTFVLIRMLSYFVWSVIIIVICKVVHFQWSMQCYHIFLLVWYSFY